MARAESQLAAHCRRLWPNHGHEPSSVSVPSIMILSALFRPSLRRKKTAPRPSTIEPLEARIAPAILDVAGGVLTYTAGGGINNAVTLSIAGPNYVLNDTGELISLTASAIAAGFTGNLTNTVQGPNAAVNSLNINTGDLNDQVSLQGLNDSLTVDTGSGAANAIFVAGPLLLAPGRDLSLTAEAITVNAPVIGGATAQFTSDAIAVNAAVTTTGSVQLRAIDPARTINLGTEVGTDFSLRDVELDRFTTPVLRIGFDTGGPIIVTQPITIGAAVPSVRLSTSTTITETGAGSLGLNFLAISSVQSVTLDAAANDVNAVAGVVTEAAATFSFRDADDLIVGTVDGIAGISTAIGGGEFVTLNAGATTQTAGSIIVSDALELLGAGPFTLNDAGNDVAMFAANVTGAVSFTDATSVDIATAGATSGVTTTNSPVAISTIDGTITVVDILAGADITAGTSTVTLTAGNPGALDNAVIISAAAGVTGTGGVTLNADHINIGEAVNGGAGTVTLQPVSVDWLIDLGSPADTAANTLELSDAELDLVTAGVLAIGSATSGNITFTAGITPALTTTVLLETGAQILDNNPGFDLTTANVGVTAVTGIGLAGTFGAIDLVASRIEAQTDTGGILLENYLAVRIGGVSAALNGVRATTSGDVLFHNFVGTVILDGAIDEDILTASGNTTVIASGAAANVEVRKGGSDGIDSDNGNVTITATQDILLGSAATDRFGDVEANGNLVLNAGRDIIIDEDSFVDTTGVGTFSGTAGRNFSILASDGTTGSRITTQGGSIAISTPVGGTFTATPGGTGGISSAGGNINITTNTAVIGSAINAGAGIVTIAPFTSATPVNLGTEVGGQLSLTDAEIDFITAGVLRIGNPASPFTGGITVTNPISPLNTTTLSLVTLGNVLDTGAGALQVANLAVAASGVNLDGVANQVANLAGIANGNFLNAFNFVNTGALNIGAADVLTGITATNGGIGISTTGSLTLNAPITATKPGATVTLTAASIIDNNAAGSDITVTNLALDTTAGIATAADFLETTVSNLEARTATGGIFLANSGGTLNIGGVTAAFDGVQATASGDITLSNAGSIILAGLSTEIVKTVSGNVLVQANGAAANIETRNNSGGHIDSDNGTVTLNAGRDILLGDAATDKFGDIEANGDLVLTAGRDVIVDEDTFVDAAGAGAITINAGRNFSMLASDGSTGSRVTTQGGAINITTGLGGIFTSTAGSGTGFSSSGGAIGINADQFVLADPLNAGAGTVTILPVAAGRPIDLGGADTAGTLGLSDAEFDLITAFSINIGDAVTGDINVTAVISPALSDTLILQTGGAINSGAAGALTAANVSAQAVTGIVLNNAANAFGNFEAQTDTGGIAVGHTGDLHIGGVSALNGVQVLTSGDLTITNAGSIIVDGDTDENVKTVSGNVTFTATGAASNIETGLDNTSISTDLGNITLVAGQDILLGDAATGRYGDTLANGNIIVTAGRDVIVDQDTFLDAFGNGTVTVNAGRDVSVLATNGSTGSHITTSGGAINITTGTGGVFTATSGSVQGIASSGGAITVNADGMTIATPVNAGAGIVTLRPVTAGTAISLGAEVGGQLSLTDAELDFVTTSLLRIGSATAGAINIAAPVSPAGTSILSLLTAGNILDGGAGDLTIANLAFTANGVNLDSGLHHVSTIAGLATGLFGTAAGYAGLASLNVGTVDGITGITTPQGGITLAVAGALAVNAPLVSGGGTLILAGSGITQTAAITQAGGGAVSIFSNNAAIVLTNPANDFTGPVTVGNTGVAAPATITDANNLILAAQNIAQQLTINAPGAVTQTGAFTGAGALTFNGPGTLTLSAANTFAGTTLVNAGILNGAGSVNGPVQIASGATLAPGTGPGIFSSGNATFASGSTFSVELNGLTPGTQHDQLAVTGAVNLGGATLAATLGFTPGFANNIILISNDGTDTVTGTFAGLPEEALVTIGGKRFIVSYVGGDGNDVSLTQFTPLAVRIVNFKTATYTDVDGDIVTIKVTKAGLTIDDFFGIATSANGSGQLQLLNFSDDNGRFSGAKVSIKVTTIVGDGFANVGYLNATGTRLGKVTIGGDLGRIDAGDPVPVKPAVKALTVQSLGAFGFETQGAGASLVSHLSGALKKLTVNTDIRDATVTSTGSIGSVNINGSILGGSITAGSTLGAVKVSGSITGTAAAPVVISALGKLPAPGSGIDLAIASITVGGSVDRLRVLAGYTPAGVGANADASIGAMSVTGAWSASSVLAGIAAGADGFVGTTDDAKLTGGNVRDNASIFSQIASITIAGAASGTSAAGDSFGIVAEQIKKANISGTALAFTSGPRSPGDFFFVGTTGPGPGGATDFGIGEVTV